MITIFRIIIGRIEVTSYAVKDIWRIYKECMNERGL